jgi:hypothetical protein
MTLGPPVAINPAGDPMTLGNMRENGVRSLDVSCWQCHHRAVLSADRRSCRVLWRTEDALGIQFTDCMDGDGSSSDQPAVREPAHA